MRLLQGTPNPKPFQQSSQLFLLRLKVAVLLPLPTGCLPLGKMSDWEDHGCGAAFPALFSIVQGMGNVKGMQGIVSSGRINPLRICSLSARSGWAI